MLDERKENRRQRLIQLMNDQFMGKQALLAERAGITPNLISRYVRGVKGIGEEMRDKIEDSCRQPRGWLDAPATTDIPSDAMKLATAHSPIVGNNVVVIRHYDTGGKMGDGGVILRDQPGLIESWTVTPEWIQKNIKNCSAAANLCVVTGFGDSMRPLYEPGDPLIVDTGVKQVDFDGIYFFRVGNEGFIKRLQRIPGEGLVAISENKAYREWTIRDGMDFEVFGRIVKAWRSEDY